jgi:hypothetical protein
MYIYTHLLDIFEGEESVSGSADTMYLCTYGNICLPIYIYTFIYVCMCVCLFMYIYIYIDTEECVSGSVDTTYSGP